MKKLISLLILIAMISLVACGNEETEDQTENANENQSNKDETIIFGYFCTFPRKG